MFFTDDGILAEVRRVCAAIARAFELGVGALDLVRDDLDHAHKLLFGLPRDLSARLDPRSLASMARPEHRELARELLAAEATLLEQAGDATGALIRRAQSDALR